MDTPNMQQLTLVPTSITGVHGIELPPDDFDPRNADTATLIRYGFPPQPDPRTKAAAVWQRTFSRKLRFVQPALSSRQEDKEGPRSVPPAAISTTPLSSNNWSGGVLFDGAPFDGIIGSWTVPSVLPPATGDGDWWAVAFVGLDGCNSDNVLQAGTSQHVNRNNGQITTEYFSWYNWFPNRWTQINSLPVHPGDTVSVSVRYLGITDGVENGLVSLINLSTGVSTTIHITPPPGITFKGNCAEWILERPSFNGQLANLPEYGHVAFTNCVAFSGDRSFDGSQAIVADMTNAGATVSAARLESDWGCSFQV
jgi:hypothetical protein